MNASDVLEAVAQAWRLDETQREALQAHDDPQGAALLISIRRTLNSLFRDLDTENEWLREPHSLIFGKTPLELLTDQTREGLRTAHEYTEVLAGR